MSKISVVITAHNYAKHLPQAIDSVLTQTFDNYELVVVDDGSTDHTSDILSKYTGNGRIHVLTLGGVGLAKAANAGIRQSSGDYVIRLDADDYFDENILLVLNNVLDRHPEYGMVFPDFYRVSKYGEVIDQVRQQKVNDEVKLLDRSALAAGALYRRSCYDAIGGYNELLSYQEDYDFWIRFIDKFHVHNVQLPLMYYRQHRGSMSTNTEPRMRARRQVKRKFVENHRNLAVKKVLCVLPMVVENRYKNGLPLVDFGGQPLMTRIIEEAQRVSLFDRIIVDTEDNEIAEVARSFGIEVPFIRPRELAKLNMSPEETLGYMARTLHREDHYDPDIIMMAYYQHPFVRAEHLEEAVDTLMIYGCDSVIGVRENTRYQWQRGEQGLTPATYPRGLLNDQKWAIYEERGGVYALDSRNLKTDSFLGKRISFIEMGELEGLRIDSEFTLWTAQEHWKKFQAEMASPRKRGKA